MQPEVVTLTAVLFVGIQGWVGKGSRQGLGSKIVFSQ